MGRSLPRQDKVAPHRNYHEASNLAESLFAVPDLRERIIVPPMPGSLTRSFGVQHSEDSAFLEELISLGARTHSVAYTGQPGSFMAAEETDLSPGGGTIPPAAFRQ